MYYQGIRLSNGTAIAHKADTPDRRLDLRLDLQRHSPTGPEWAYSGSGPAQLALALLCDATGDDAQALRLHQQFKREVVAQLPHEGWTLLPREILAWVEQAEPLQPRGVGRTS